MKRVALVTGANQGIGLEVVRQLLKKFDGTVLLAARSTQRGQEAVDKLISEGLSPEFLLLDVDSGDSIGRAREEVEHKYGRLDVLINNAGIGGTGLAFAEKARCVIRTNYHGLLNVTNAFAPLLHANSRVVNVSSGMGLLSYLSEARRAEFMDENLTVEKLTALVDQFVKDAAKADYETTDWPNPSVSAIPYRVSKISVSRLTELQAKLLTADPAKPGILVNSLCPGWVQTRLGTQTASSTVEEGAETPVYLALLPAGATEPNGQFVERCKVTNRWKNI